MPSKSDQLIFAPGNAEAVAIGARAAIKRLFQSLHAAEPFVPTLFAGIATSLPVFALIARLTPRAAPRLTDTGNDTSSAAT